MSNVDVPISDKARERIDDARAREINFYVRRLLERGGYRPEEIEAVAAVIIDTFQRNEKLTREHLLRRLLERGLPREAAEQISGEIGVR